MDLDLLLPHRPAKRNLWRWGTVTQTDPTRVCLDGDAAPLLASVSMLGDAKVGDRVYCHLDGHRVVVFPRALPDGASKSWVNDAIAAAQFISPRDESDIPSSYPAGISVFDSHGTSGWPLSYGTVLTAGVSAHRMLQVFSDKGSNFWFRSANSSVWSAWVPLQQDPLPESQYVAGSSSTNQISGTSWSTIPGCSGSLWLSAPAYVTFDYGVWMAKAHDIDARVGLLLTGQTSKAENLPNWSAVLWSGSDNQVDAQLSTSITWKLNAGTTNFYLRAYRATGAAGTFFNANYPFINVTPVRWA